jgi:L-ascorbate 6-phosphate lactonase
MKGQALIRDLEACRVEPGELAIWWLGQHSFVVKAGTTVIYLDPFLTALPGREGEPFLPPGEIPNAAIIPGSPAPADHIDRPAWPVLAKASPTAAFVLPDLLRPAIAAGTGIPLPRLVGLDDGVTVELGDVRITGVAAAHEFLDRDPASGRYPYLGFVIEANGCVFYHSGDCCNYEGLVTRLRRWCHDVVFLPINGRDAVRLAANYIGNMTYQEAADLAGALGPGLTVPAHYEMFANNRQDPQPFVDYMQVKYPALATAVLEHGRRFLYRKAPSIQR